MKISRKCPRCREKRNHLVEQPKDGNDTPLHRRDTPDIPVKVWVNCAECGHRWRGRLSRVERGYEI
jgi:DNA-directed RNA polymerase subunit M/transcription elongation factor TFIIS